MINIPVPVAVGTSAVHVATVPGGSCVAVLSNTGSTNTIYVGTSDNVTASGGGQGFPLPAGATVTVPGYPGSGSVDLWAIAAASGNSIGVIISTSG